MLDVSRFDVRVVVSLTQIELSEAEAAVSTNTTRSNEPSGQTSRGRAPERAGEVLVFVGSGLFGQVDLVEAASSTSVLSGKVERLFP